METFVYRPEITFEDTNLVGNVYFANFVRWQNECRNDWLKATDFHTYSQVFRRTKQLLVEEVDLQFLDPAGATLGDVIEVVMTVQSIDHQSYRGLFEIRRLPQPGSNGGVALLARGHQCFAFVDQKCQWRQGGSSQSFASRSGPAFVLDVPVPLDAGRSGTQLDSLDLIRLQGKCREQFLATHAPGILAAVSAATLALHTNRVSYTLLDPADVDPADLIRLEMRMTDLKSRLTVEFTYLLISGRDCGASPRKIASGAQVLCCKRRNADQQFVASVFPVEMLAALVRYTDSDQLRSTIDVLLEHQSSHHKVTASNRSTTVQSRMQ